MDLRSREVFLTTELTIDGFGANGDSAYESVKEHKDRLFPGVKTSKTIENQQKPSPQIGLGRRCRRFESCHSDHIECS